MSRSINKLNANSKRQQLQLFGVASCLGAQDQRCANAPQSLQTAGLVTTLQMRGIDARWQQILTPEATHKDSLSELYQRLAKEVQQTTKLRSPFLVIGGDHSCAMGTWSGAAQGLREQDAEADLGLIWVDAHMDAHTETTSPSGALHGMPVASLLGQGDKTYRDIAFSGAKIKPKNLCLIGIRSYEQEEAKLLHDLGVKVYFIEDVRALGLDKTLQLAITQVSRQTAGFGISIDMDAIDPQDAPGVGSPVDNGLTAQELLPTFTHLRQYITANPSPLLGVEIAELNPERDINHKTQALIIDIIHSIFGDSNEYE
ncbi:MAG: arginase [Thiohalomonadales bacterium]